MSSDVQVLKLTGSLSITPKDSGRHHLYSPDSVQVGWNIVNPFPYQVYDNYQVDLGNGWGPFEYSSLYPDAYYNYDYPTELIQPSLKIKLKSGVEYHCATEVKYDLIPRKMAIHYNSWNGKDTTFYEGDTLWLYDTNPNASDEWSGSGIVVNKGDHIGITSSGRATHYIYGEYDYGYEDVYYTMKPRSLKAAFAVNTDACDESKIDLTFTGAYSQTDTITSYDWLINGSEKYTSKHPGNIELTREGNNTISLSVKTVSGDTASISQVINVPARWLITATMSMYGCGDSALLSTTNTATAAYSVMWNNGMSGNEINVNKTGLHYVSLKDNCGNIRAYDSVYVNLEIPKMPPPVSRVNNMLVTVNYDGYTNNWYRNDTLIATGMMVELTAPGVYKVDQVIGICKQVSEPYYYYSELTTSLEATAPACDSMSWTAKGSVLFVPETEQVVAEAYDFGDGTATSTVGTHQYAQPGNYTITYTVTTSSGSSAVRSKDILVKLPPAIRMEIHRGTQDTIIAYPVNYDYAQYQEVRWLKDESTVIGANAWYIIPSGDGYYRLASNAYSCYYASPIYYTATAAKAIVVIPADNADSLRLEANFRGTVFNEDNEFTIQLATDDGNARTLTAGEVINLGIIKGTDPTNLSVAIPDSLPCGSNYVIRVVSSSPIDFTSWSGEFTITNQPAQPVITQVGDSLFTSSTYELQWYKDDVAITGAGAIRAKANGVYKVAALNGTCSTLSETRSVVITAVGDVTVGSNKVSVFPNPSAGQVYLKFATAPTKQALVRILDVSGAVVYRTTTIQQQTLLELSTLPKGYYLVEVTGYGTRKVLPLILQ